MELFAKSRVDRARLYILAKAKNLKILGDGAHKPGTRGNNESAVKQGAHAGKQLDMVSIPTT